MLSLSDDELRIVLDCASPLAPEDRTRFLEAVASELAKFRDNIGPGVVSRTCRELRAFIEPHRAVHLNDAACRSGRPWPKAAQRQTGQTW
jgi:hypothetical protein